MRTDTTVDLSGLRAAARLKQKADAEVLERIHQAREDGASLRAIADAAGLSHQRIHQIVGRVETAA